MLMLHEVGKNRYVNKHDIIYLEGNGKKCILHFTDRKKDFECNKTLASIEEMILCYRIISTSFNHFFY